MGNIQMKIYNSSPVSVQNILTMIDGYRKVKDRYGKVYYEFLEELEQHDFSDKAAEIAYQEQEMRKLIKHAKAKSPFYREFYADIDLDSIRTLEDLKKIPVLEKEMVRSKGPMMYTVSEADGCPSTTSGTSGTPQRVLYTKDDLQKRMAFLDHFKKQHGAINMKMKKASFSDQQFVPRNQKANIYWRDNVSGKQRLYSAFHCQEKTARYIAENINEYQPAFFDGLPSSIYEIAKWMNQNNFKLSYRPIGIFPSGETLYPHYREAMEKAFGCPVRDQYASSEGAPFIIECPKGKLHYHMMTGIIETTPEGSMLVTCFNTYGTPLIRYNIGDQIEWADESEQCDCGWAYPIVKSIQGRSNDYLQARNGQRFTGVYMAVSSDWLIKNVRKIQYVQHDADTIEALIEVADGDKERAVSAVRDKLEYLFGNEMNLQVRIVEKIPFQSNGKHRLIVNKMTQRT